MSFRLLSYFRGFHGQWSKVRKVGISGDSFGMKADSFETGEVQGARIWVRLAVGDVRYLSRFVFVAFRASFLRAAQSSFGRAVHFSWPNLKCL
jgi:hypothetical protein